MANQWATIMTTLEQFLPLRMAQEVFYNLNPETIVQLFFRSHGKKVTDNLHFTGPGSKNAAVTPLAGRLLLVVGAGGAGKAIAYGAKEKGARIVVANRTYGKFFFVFVSETKCSMLAAVIQLFICKA